MPEGIFTDKNQNLPLPMGSAALEARITALHARYPFLHCRTLAHADGGRRVSALELGQGRQCVLLTAGHHANEYITSMLCMTLLEDYLRAVVTDARFGGENARELFRKTRVCAVPMLCPGGVDLVTGCVPKESGEYRAAQEIAARFPAVPFPDGWKANLQGVDLNLNYPARWELAREIKAARGVAAPAPRDFVGAGPLDQPETAALSAYTHHIQPQCVVAWHTQGRVIYRSGAECLGPEAERLARRLASVSGYALEAVPPESANAGFRDWFVQRFRRPGFTVEAGFGENPLPLSQLPKLVQENTPLMAQVLTFCARSAC